MKHYLVSINSKYIHSSYGTALIKGYVQAQSHYSVIEKTYTINQQIEHIERDLLFYAPDTIAFSTYIWNIEIIQKIAATIKLALPEVKIILGGPEVSYGPENYLTQPWCDYIIMGEGEAPYLALIKSLEEGQAPMHPAIASKDNHQNKVYHRMENLDLIPFPYETFDPTKIHYYESSRGCPFNCSYCLSSSTKGVRYLSIERVKEDLLIFIENEVKLVKFIDRTFNADLDRAKEIISFLMEHDRGKTSFHVELAPQFLTQDFIELLGQARKDLLQFEIGIQTIHDDVTRSIKRPKRFDDLKHHLQSLIALGNAHTHVDLIAGLPYESYDRFLASFDQVFSLGADHFQLGFLKVLKGSDLAKDLLEHAYKVRTYPPYEVIENRYLSARELLILKDIEVLLEHYYNSHRFQRSMDTLLGYFDRPSALFQGLQVYFNRRGLLHKPHKQENYYEYLYDFAEELGGDLKRLSGHLQYDYLKNNRYKPLQFFHEPLSIDKPWLHRLIQNNDFLRQFLPAYVDQSGKILKEVSFYRFASNLLTGAKEDSLMMVQHKSNSADIIQLKECLPYEDYS